MKPIITLFLLFGCFLAHTQTLESFERYFTWNPDSTLVYEQASKDSKLLDKLAYGTEVEIIENTSKESILYLGKNNVYEVKGLWIKIKIGSLEGYSFNGEVINFPPFKVEGSHYTRDKEHLQSYFTEELKSYERIDSTKIQGGTYWKTYVDSLAYPDGSFTKIVGSDGCFNRTYHFKNKTLAQVYFIMKTHFYNGNVWPSPASDFYPKLTVIHGDKMFFYSNTLESIEGIFIDFNDPKLIFFGSSDCT